MLTLLTSAATACLVVATPPTIQGNVTFHPPVPLGEARWGVTMFAAFNHSAHAIQMPAAMQVTLDGGATYTKQPMLGRVVPVVSNLVPGPSGPHDFGNISAHQSGPGPWTSLASATSTTWRLDAKGTLSTVTSSKAVTFSGLPVPIHCDPSYSTCAIRLQGSGIVAFGDGSLLQSAIVFYNGVPKFPRATSVVVFRSTDGGFDWRYQGCIANATDYAFSQEGPNEHDLTMLDFGQVMAVVRLDAGDGLASHPYAPYYFTVSQDGGRTWPKMQPMPGTGCARPRLLQLGDGYAPLLMSGGRMKFNGNGSASDDNLLWISWQGVKFPALEPTGPTGWEMYALSYYHNLLAGPGTPRFTSAVNDTNAGAETAAYTALIQTGKCSAVVLYDLSRKSTGRQGFSMRIDIHLDEGGEAGIHC